MASRLKLHEELCALLGSRNAYFQPPASVLMQYPAIRYSLDGINNDFADNEVYMQNLSYEIILIVTDPDSELIFKVSRLPKCKFDRSYAADNLYHYVFTINY